MATEKLQLEVPVLLPKVPDGRDECVARLEDMLGARPGISEVHVLADEEPALLCIHYEPGKISLSRVRDLARSGGARLTDRYGHFVAELAEASTPRRAASKADRLSRIEGVIEAAVSGAGAIRVEYDREALSIHDLRSRIAGLGLEVQREHDDGEAAAGPEEERAEDHAHEHGGSRLELGFALASGFFMLVGWLLPDVSTAWMAPAPFWAAYFFGGYFTAKEAFESVRDGKFEIDFLMLVAAAGAAALGEWLEGGLLLFLFSLGHSLEHFAMARARRAIESLADLAPERALVIRDGSEEKVSVEDLRVGVLIPTPTPAV